MNYYALAVCKNEKRLQQRCRCRPHRRKHLYQLTFCIYVPVSAIVKLSHANSMENVANGSISSSNISIFMPKKKAKHKRNNIRVRCRNEVYFCLRNDTRDLKCPRRKRKRARENEKNEKVSEKKIALK